MEKIEKIFTNVKPINHSGNSESGKNVLRIKDKNFSIDSIYKILEHMNWVIDKKGSTEKVNSIWK